MSAQSACRLPSSYLPLVSQDITAGRPSAGQGQPSCAVERLTSAMSVCVWPRSGSEKRGRPGFSEIWTQRSPLHGARGKGTKAWGLAVAAAAEAPGNQACGGGDGRARDVGNRDCERRAGGTRSCPLYETARSVVGRTDKDRVSKHSDQRLCKQDDDILGEMTWIFRLNPNPRARE